MIASDDPDYDSARKLFNAMIDKRPRLIAQCVDAADVIAAINVAREAGLDVAVRCGAHNGPGLGSVDDGLVIDLSALRGVIVDPNARIAHVLGGTLLGEVDHAAQAFGARRAFRDHFHYRRRRADTRRRRGPHDAQARAVTSGTGVRTS